MGSAWGCGGKSGSSSWNFGGRWVIWSWDILGIWGLEMGVSERTSFTDSSSTTGGGCGGGGGVEALSWVFWIWVGSGSVTEDLAWKWRLLGPFGWW